MTLHLERNFLVGESGNSCLRQRILLHPFVAFRECSLLAAGSTAVYRTRNSINARFSLGYWVYLIVDGTGMCRRQDVPRQIQSQDCTGIEFALSPWLHGSHFTHKQGAMRSK